MNKIGLILLFFLLGSIGTQAQFLRDSLNFVVNNYSQKRLYSTFDKQLNTYTLNTGFVYNIDKEKYFIGVNENFNSSIVKSSTKSIKDDQQVSLLGEYRFSPKFKSGMLVSSNLFSDDRKLDINEASSFLGSIYTKIEPIEQLKLIPFFGYSNNKQISEVDNGLIYGTEALLDNFSSDDFQIYSSLNFRNEDILPRRNLLRNIKITALNVIENNFVNIINGGYSEMRKDFYFEADSITSATFDVKSNIQSRTEQNYLIEDIFEFKDPDSEFGFEFGGSVGWRDIARRNKYLSAENVNTTLFNTNINEFRIDLNASLIYVNNNFRSRVKIGLNEREEKHSVENIPDLSELIFNERDELENRKNNRSQIVNFIYTGDWDFSDRDKISFSLFHRKLVYDTPSEENNDDRDELLSIFRTAYQHEFSTLFTYFLHFEGSLNHIVYIFSERSSNNNIRRIIKLTSGGYYNSEILNNKLEAEVSANYTVYDFEDLQPNFQSYAFRQFALKDSTSLTLSKRITADITGYAKLSEQGDFNWTEFSGKPQRYLEEYYLEPKIFVHKGALQFGTGFRYFNLTTYNFEDITTRKKTSEYNSVGPIVDIIMRVGGTLNLKIYGWYEFIRPEDGKNRENVNLNVRLYWNIL